ncbi:winged helix-turn-helix domain-containing protein, partial [Klebsiella pneumoniae]|uniref:winged helix-turn-helix domain-containing protein n=1 Tax=Klebsiella pneumoniae TaxID=573 RepID=UPI000E342914
GLFKKDDLIAWVWGRKGVVVSSASYYKLINQLRGSFEKIGLPSSAVLTRPKVGVTLSVTIEPLPDESTPVTQNRASDTVAPVAESLPEPTQSWLFLICATLFLLMVIYLYSKRHPDYFSELGTYNGYTFYGVTEDNRSLEDAVGAFSELSQQVYKQNGNFIYYIRVPDTNIFVQCLNQLN